MNNIKTYGRLLTKYGGTIEDVLLSDNFSVKQKLGNWHFINEFSGLSKEIVNRFSMIYLTENMLERLGR